MSDNRYYVKRKERNWIPISWLSVDQLLIFSEVVLSLFFVSAVATHHRLSTTSCTFPCRRRSILQDISAIRRWLRGPTRSTPASKSSKPHPPRRSDNPPAAPAPAHPTAANRY